MASRRDEVQKCVDSVILEPWVTLDSRLFGKNVIVFPLEILNDLGETVKRSESAM